MLTVARAVTLLGRGPLLWEQMESWLPAPLTGQGRVPLARIILSLGPPLDRILAGGS